MIYNTKEEFIQKYTIGKLGLVEYIKNLEKLGKELLKNRIVKTPRTLVDNWSFYKSVRQSIGWK